MAQRTFRRHLNSPTQTVNDESLLSLFMTPEIAIIGAVTIIKEIEIFSLSLLRLPVLILEGSDEKRFTIVVIITMRDEKCVLNERRK